MLHKIPKRNSLPSTEDLTIPTYGRSGLAGEPPKTQMPDQGVLPETAYTIIHDELSLDGNSRANLATFVSTWMEPEATQLLVENFDKNLVNKDEYPHTTELEVRCVSILAHLWHAPDTEDAMGTSTLGSSEACMLAGLAMHRRWRNRRRAEGKPTDRPNIVVSSTVQVCWEKFFRYWDIEARLVPVTGNRFTATGAEIAALCDENTIGVVGILGTTYTGEYEPIADMDAALEKLNAKTGWDIGIHVDAASGGLVAPFLEPDLVWDFRLKLVRSINVSGHKYGLVYPGVGWVVWRSKEYLPDELIFHVHYLTGDMPTFGINFSRPGGQVVAQYYNFLRLGREGYTRVHETSRSVAQYLAAELAQMEPFEVINNGDNLPLVAWKIKEDAKVNFDLYDFTDRLHMNGWLVPAYAMPKDRDKLVIARVVVKHGFSLDLAEALVADLKLHLEHFMNKANDSVDSSESAAYGIET